MLTDLLERVRAGRANKVHFVQLLDLMEEGGVSTAAGITEVELLEELVRTVDATDRAQISRLARVYGSVGNADVAGLLYRWSVMSGAASNRLGNGVSLRELVRAAKKHIDGPELFALVEEILRWSKPQDGVFFYALEAYETSSLELWEEVAGPAEALERCRALCAEILDVRQALRRDSAKAAVSLLARAGELDMALRCLEVALCKLPTEGVEAEYSFQLRAYEQPGRVGHDDLRKMFPKDSESWEAPRRWFERAGSSLVAWLDEGRVDVATAVRAVCVIACRMSELGAQEEAVALLDRLSAVDGVSAPDQLWLADAWRVTGQPTRAHELELQLLREGRLLMARAVEVVQYAVAEQGALAALQIGTDAAEITQDKALLGLLAQLAEELGKVDEAAMWNKRNAEAEAARRELKERSKAGAR